MTEPAAEYSMLDSRTQTDRDREFYRQIADYFSRSPGTTIDKLRNFPKFVPRQVLATFLLKVEMFRHILPVHGHIIECGVFLGGGLFSWAQLSSIHEPYNHTRRVIGFDSFAGFPSIHGKDEADAPEYVRAGGLAADVHADLMRCAEIHDLNRPIGHIPRVELVRGDAVRTIPKYVEDNQHLVVAMLYLDFDLYEPTKVAIDTLLPRMPRGAVLAFDELNQPSWPGETLAALETVGIRNLRLQRLPFNPQIAYAVLD
jgi:hypothetical protein